ncbi:MAG: hypothetical protein KatS3mg035_1134 [Bacteroidia bacterium]|nr:MAG: hypothetical protein KatS3mg035_1134 [Bacteroidia bacterium]
MGENIVAENRKIRKELLDDIHVESKIDNKLAESINTLIESVSKQNFIDFEREQEAYEYLMNYLTREVINESQVSSEKTDNPDLLDNAWKFITKVAVSNFNERYQHLNEEEKKIFSILISDEKTKNSFLEEIKSENISLIESKLMEESDQNTINLLNTFKTKIENMKNVNFVNIDEYIISNIELRDILKQQIINN